MSILEIIHCIWCVRFFNFDGIEYQRVEIYEDVWKNTIVTGRKNYFECVFISKGVMFEHFFNGGWPYKYRVENIIVNEMSQIPLFALPLFIC